MADPGAALWQGKAVLLTLVEPVDEQIQGIISSLIPQHHLTIDQGMFSLY
jgi:hypothetical protein